MRMAYSVNGGLMDGNELNSTMQTSNTSVVTVDVHSWGVSYMNGLSMPIVSNTCAISVGRRVRFSAGSAKSPVTVPARA